MGDNVPKLNLNRLGFIGNKLCKEHRQAFRARYKAKALFSLPMCTRKKTFSDPLPIIVIQTLLIQIIDGDQKDGFPVPTMGGPHSEKIV